MQYNLELPEVYQPLLKEMLKAGNFEDNHEGLLALVRASLKDHAKTLASQCLEKRKFTEAQNIVDRVNDINRELFPPATAKATQLIFMLRKKKEEISWEIKEYYASKGTFYETINPDGTPGKEGTKERGSLTELMAAEVLG